MNSICYWRICGPIDAFVDGARMGGVKCPVELAVPLSWRPLALARGSKPSGSLGISACHASTATGSASAGHLRTSVHAQGLMLHDLVRLSLWQWVDFWAQGTYLRHTSCIKTKMEVQQVNFVDPTNPADISHWNQEPSDFSWLSLGIPSM